jgi:catechol 2,3-dioxygenase-like lactoylglutathione lyase family enzyme
LKQLITGIQQVGIGVTNIDEAWPWYRKFFGTDIPVFDDEAEAKLMTPYTGGDVHSRRALLALNLSGGGGFEIWQFKSRQPEVCDFDIQLGDLGINAVKIKSKDVKKAYQRFKVLGNETLSELHELPNGEFTFWTKDPYNNLFQVVNGNSWFQKGSHCTGGVCGATIGVSDIDAVLPLYTTALGFDEVIYDETGSFSDLDNNHKFRRILLRKAQKDEGAFSRLFGHIDIELIQSLDREPQKIYEDRYWGDPGFIHLCFDVTDMNALQKKCEEIGYPFTIDSADSFDMGDAAGQFSYIEDPDGTLIEFVEAHKVPIFEKWGWFINLKKRNHNKPLPNWMLKTMSFKRVKG